MDAPNPGRDRPRRAQLNRTALGIGALLLVAGAITAVVGPPRARTVDAPRLPPILAAGPGSAGPIIGPPTRPTMSRRDRFAIERAQPGEAVPVQLTQYCLRGTTRRGRYVRPGIVAADPRIFPLGHYVEIFAGTRYLGRFLVDDTGGLIKGRIIDIWVPDCRDALRFGRRRGTASLVATPP